MCVSTFFPIVFGGYSDLVPYLTAFERRYHLQSYESHYKKDYPPLDRDGVFDRYTIFSFNPRFMYLNMLIPAVVGIVSFSLAILPTNQYYYQTPMGIIGKFYANSMLFLINSRMLLQVGSGGAPLMIISTMRFDLDATPTIANHSNT